MVEMVVEAVIHNSNRNQQLWTLLPLKYTKHIFVEHGVLEVETICLVKMVKINTQSS